MDSFNPYESESAPKISVDFKRHRGSSKKSGIGAVNAGGAVIIIIFVVLCLTIFGLLSFATSFADKKLADRSLDGMVNFYAADSKAEEKLAQIYGALYAGIPAGYFDEAYVSAAVSDIQDIYKVENKRENAVQVYFTTDISISRDKSVRTYLRSGIEFYYDAQTPGTDRLTYRIIEWKIINDSDVDYSFNPENIWDGVSNHFGDDE